MRTVTFKSVLHGVATLMGLEPTVNLLTNQAASFTEYINEELRRAWEKFDFPELTTIEQRAYRNAYNNATAYVIGDEIYYSTTDAYYTCTANSTGNLPTNTSYWSELTEFNRYVAYEQTGKTKLGEVFEVWENDPRTSRSYVDVPFWLSDLGVEVDLDAPTQVYLKFRKRPNQFTSTVWDTSTSYVVDDLVYYATTGECYISIQAGSNKNPSSQTSYWTKVDFPYVLASYVKLAAYSRALKEDGQYEKGQLAMEDAENRLQDEYDKLIFQQKQAPRFRVRNQ